MANLFNGCQSSMNLLATVRIPSTIASKSLSMFKKIKYEFLDFIKKEMNLAPFFEHQIVCKMFHFQTKSGFRHTKIDSYSTKFAANFDQFMEVLQGIGGTVDNTSIEVKARMRSDENIASHLEAMIKFLDGLTWNGKDLPRELAQIVDLMIADIRQTLYLFQFQ